MMVMLKLIFIFIMIVLVIGIVLIAGFVHNIFSLFRSVKHSSQNRNDQFTNGQQRNSGSANAEFSQTTYRPQPHRNKIIPEDEGEYVDFEEMK